MTKSPVEKRDQSQTMPGFLFLSILWLQFCFVLAPSWRGGTYYDYGWFVPPVIAYLAYLRWQDSPTTSVPSSRTPPWVLAVIVLGVLSLIPMRIVQHVDIFWRLPLWLHAGVLLTITHFTISMMTCWKKSFLLMPATFLILVAVPLFSAIENGLVQTLTRWVLDLTINVLPIMGYPAIIVGSSFIVNGQILDVAEGCSGIRSFQGCAMAALILGELRRFSVVRRLALLGLALTTAIITNSTRIVVLTQLTYNEGYHAMEAAHDSIGAWTAIITYALIGLLAWILGPKIRTLRKNA